MKKVIVKKVLISRLRRQREIMADCRFLMGYREAIQDVFWDLFKLPLDFELREDERIINLYK